MGLVLLSSGKKWGAITEPVNGNPDKIVFRFDNGPNNSTDIYNEGSSAAPFIQVGTPKMVNSPRRFGSFAGDFRTGSLKFDPRFDHLLGAKDFTLEFNCVLYARGGAASFVLSSTSGSTLNWGFSLGNDNYNNIPNFFVNRLLSGSAYWWGGQVTIGAVVGYSGWNHFSVTRQGGEIYAHRNGVYLPASLFTIGDGIPVESDMSKPPIIEIASNNAMILDDVWMHIGSAVRGKANFTVAAI